MIYYYIIEEGSFPPKQHGLFSSKEERRKYARKLIKEGSHAHMLVGCYFDTQSGDIGVDVEFSEPSALGIADQL